MPDPQVAQQGLSNLANSIRRSTALYVAMSVTPPESTDEELLARADKFAIWLAGRAGALEAAGEQPLGRNPWD